MNWLIDALTVVASIVALAGILVVLVGGVQALVNYIGEQIREFSGEREADYYMIRRRFAEKILIGLEFFVAADLIKTIAAPTLQDVALLASIVAIRIALSLSIGREIKVGGGEAGKNEAA